MGYYSTSLCKNGKHKTHLIHRLVATAFVSNPLDLSVVNHLDSDRLNNHYTNLEWTTHDGNVKHKVKLGLHARGEMFSKSKLTDKIVKEIRLMWKTNNFFAYDLAKQFNVSPSLISKVTNLRIWKHVQ